MRCSSLQSSCLPAASSPTVSMHPIDPDRVLKDEEGIAGVLGGDSHLGCWMLLSGLCMPESIMIPMAGPRSRPLATRGCLGNFVQRPLKGSFDRFLSVLQLFVTHHSQLPFKIPYIPPNRNQKALNRDTQGVDIEPACIVRWQHTIAVGGDRLIGCVAQAQRRQRARVRCQRHGQPPCLDIEINRNDKKRQIDTDMDADFAIHCLSDRTGADHVPSTVIFPHPVKTHHKKATAYLLGLCFAVPSQAFFIPTPPNAQPERRMSPYQLSIFNIWQGKS